MQKTCRITGRPFEVTPEEMVLRTKLNVEGEPDLHPAYRFLHLSAFWQHWNLHRRTCEKTGKELISVFSENCPYPVWHHEEWVKNAEPPTAEYHMNKAMFPQMWDLFSLCPIGHNMGAGNQNCEYTDDWWYSKNCYLCHSGLENEDLRYCYRAIRVKNCQFCTFCWNSERCRDLINCTDCFQVLYGYNSRNCSDCAFIYDCRGCTKCAFCWNLRNKEYCFFNEQLTKEGYERKLAEWDLRSRAVYFRALEEFKNLLKTRAWHRSLFIDRSELANGNYIDQCKNVHNCFFLSNEMEDCANVLRSGFSNDCLDSVSPYGSELQYNCSTVQDKSYDTRMCYNLIQCKFMEYSAHCFQCQYCFGCCGLVGKKYCISNKQYSPEEYEIRKAQLIAHMKSTGEYGKFFPGHFAATPYAESLAGFYWPLGADSIRKFGFRERHEPERMPHNAQPAEAVPDRCDQAGADLPNLVFWDNEAKRPFRIEQADIDFAQKLGCPLSHRYYSLHLQENFHMIPFDGTLREITCGLCAGKTKTSWSKEYDGRVLCQECYLKEVY